MSLEFVPLQFSKHSVNFWNLYNVSFKQNLRFPKRHITRNEWTPVVIYINDCFIGLVISHFIHSVLYIDYLAIDPQFQGKGYGTQIIKLLLNTRFLIIKKQ